MAHDASNAQTTFAKDVLTETRPFKQMALTISVERLLKQHVSAKSMKKNNDDPKTPIFRLPIDIEVEFLPIESVFVEVLKVSKKIPLKTVQMLQESETKNKSKQDGATFEYKTPLVDPALGTVHVYYIPPCNTVALQERLVAGLKHAEASNDARVVGIHASLFRDDRVFFDVLAYLDTMSQPPIIFVYGSDVLHPKATFFIENQSIPWQFWEPLKLALYINEKRESLKRKQALKMSQFEIVTDMQDHLETLAHMIISMSPLSFSLFPYTAMYGINSDVLMMYNTPTILRMVASIDPSIIAFVNSNPAKKMYETPYSVLKEYPYFPTLVYFLNDPNSESEVYTALNTLYVERGLTVGIFPLHSEDFAVNSIQANCNMIANVVRKHFLSVAEGNMYQNPTDTPEPPQSIASTVHSKARSTVKNGLSYIRTASKNTKPVSSFTAKKLPKSAIADSNSRRTNATQSHKLFFFANDDCSHWARAFKVEMTFFEWFAANVLYTVSELQILKQKYGG
eukprot:2824297-Rhodomonas_salina.3